MDIKITGKTDNPLLPRTEITAEIGYEKQTPSRQDVRQKLSAGLKIPAENIIIAEIRTIFGERKALVRANAYKKKEDLEKTETAVLKNRNAAAKKGDAAETKEIAAEKKQEPAKEKKEASSEKKQEAVKEKKE